MSFTLRRHGLLVFLVLCIFLSCWEARGQISYQFIGRSFGVSARSAALADAYVADASDPSCMYWNPAALYFVKKSTIVLNHFMERKFDIMSENLTIPIFLHSAQAIAIGARVTHVGYLRETIIPDFQNVQYSLELAYATEIARSLSLGGTVGVRTTSYESSSIWSASSSVGLFYSPSEEISYGISYGGIGSGIRYDYDGVNVRLSRENLPRNLQIGGSLRFPIGSTDPSVTLSFANEKLFEQDGLRYKGGLEIFLLRYLAVRAGYLVQPGDVAAKYGTGLRLGRVRIDYAIAPNNSSDHFQQASLLVDF